MSKKNQASGAGNAGNTNNGGNTMDISKLDLTNMSPADLLTLQEQLNAQASRIQEAKQAEEASLREAIFTMFKESTCFSNLASPVSTALDNIFNGVDVSKASTSKEIVDAIKALGIKDLSKEFCFDGDSTVYKLRIMKKPARKKSEKSDKE